MAKKPLGRAIVRPDAERERLAAITPDDIVDARLEWRNKAPVRAKGLMEAKAEDDAKDR